MASEPNQKQNLKRPRETSSVGSSTASPNSNLKEFNMEKWKNGAYIPIYLAHLGDVVSGAETIEKPQYSMTFWISFSTKLNLLIKDSLTLDEAANFKEYNVSLVISYGKYLRSSYYKQKNTPSLRTELYDLFQRAFGKCSRCPHLPVFPHTLSFSTDENGTRKRSRSQNSVDSVVSCGADYSRSVSRMALKQLVELKMISAQETISFINAMSKELDEVRDFWSTLSIEDQMSFLRELVPAPQQP